MSLQTKFALLLGVIGLTVILSISASIWAINHMQNEVRRPFEVMSSALIQLQAIRFALEKQQELLVDPGTPSADDAADPGTRGQFEEQGRKISSAMQRLVADDAVTTVTGKTSLANLRNRLSETRDLGETWLARPTPDAHGGAAAALTNTLSLVRRIESRIIEDTHRLVIRATDVRRELVVLSAIVAILIVLLCILGLLLVRRWVVQPVAELRTAAGRIAAGDFAHRIPVRGLDELGSLSKEVNSMAGMVKRMQDEAVERERLAAVGEVARRIAHNLRSPLAGIRGLAELSRRELDSPSVAPELRADIGENQDRIIGAVDRFEHWLRDLLQATRPLEIVHQSLDPAEWLGRVVEAYRPKAQATRIRLELDATHAPKRAAFDPRHLELALGALISNALDSIASSPHPPSQAGVVSVTCRQLAREDGKASDQWELRVQDNGLGVPAELRERIFAPYFTTKREGTGIGLALAQQVVRAHGGTLTLQDIPHDGGITGALAPGDRGAVFSARMPIGPIESDSSGVATAGHPEVLSGQNSAHRG